jgi:ATP-dependent exoDNAse (exonuclease V) alpha subunit
MDQKQALKILKKGKNVFLTGPAGSGKTYILREFIEHLKKENKKHAVTASTGIAATHIDGTTIHSWAGVGINESLTGRELQKLADNEHIQERFLACDVLIIDEISMIDARLLELLDEVCKAVKRSAQPFGGLQIIMSGDFFQLPPVRTDKSKAILAYNAPSWKNAKLSVCYLDEQYRHMDEAFLQVLNDIRSNNANHETEEALSARYNQKVKSREYVTKLFSRNKDADTVNELELEKLDSEPYAYTMHAKGDKAAINQLKKDYNKIPQELVLKVGARVMFTKNKFERGYVNGTMGEVVDFWEDDDELMLPIVRLKSGKTIHVGLGSWSMEHNGLVIASIIQVPLRLAWAITIHKSQGMTLDTAEINLSNTFGHGMGYVALSRVRSLATLNLTGFNSRAFLVDPEVSEMDKEFREMSD